MTTIGELGRRDAILTATAEKLAKVGSDAIDIGAICRQLDVSPSLVNHFFGSKSHLLIDAAIKGYEGYVLGQFAAVERAGDNPNAQLRSWIEAQVEWTLNNPGIASMMNFPRLHLPDGEALRPEARLQLEGSAGRNLILLASILDRIQRGSSGRELISREEVGSNAGLAAATAYVGWLVYGHALWRSGQHAPTSDLPEVRANEDAIFAGVPLIAAQIAKGLAGRS